MNPLAKAGSLASSARSLHIQKHVRAMQSGVDLGDEGLWNLVAVSRLEGMADSSDELIHQSGHSGASNMIQSDSLLTEIVRTRQFPHSLRAIRRNPVKPPGFPCRKHDQPRKSYPRLTFCHLTASLFSGE